MISAVGNLRIFDDYRVKVILQRIFNFIYFWLNFDIFYVKFIIYIGVTIIF